MPVGRSLPENITPVSDDVRQIVAASLRLGRWFAREEMSTLCNRLHVRV